jgi:hypothetical protein
MAAARRAYEQTAYKNMLADYERGYGLLARHAAAAGVSVPPSAGLRPSGKKDDKTEGAKGAEKGMAPAAQAETLSKALELLRGVAETVKSHQEFLKSKGYTPPKE